MKHLHKNRHPLILYLIARGSQAKAIVRTPGTVIMCQVKDFWIEFLHNGMAHTGHTVGMVKPHVARGNAPQWGRTVEHHVLQSCKGRNVGAPSLLFNHVLHPGSVLTSYAGLYFGTAELICRVICVHKRSADKDTNGKSSRQSAGKGNISHRSEIRRLTEKYLCIQKLVALNKHRCNIDATGMGRGHSSKPVRVLSVTCFKETAVGVVFVACVLVTHGGNI